MRHSLGGDYHHWDLTIMHTDTRVAFGVAGFYILLTAALLPVSEYPRALGIGAAIFIGVAGLAALLGRGGVPMYSVIGISFASFYLLVFPTLPAMGGPGAAATYLGFLGVQAAVLLWAACRWEPRSRAAMRTSPVPIWRMSALIATGISALATIPVIIALGTGRPEATSLLLIYPAYFAGFFAAGTVYWLLQPIAHLAVGRYLIGLLGGICVFLAVSPLIGIIQHQSIGLSMMLAVALIGGAFLGPAVTLQFDDAAPAA